MVSCNNILPYEIPVSRFLGYRKFIPTTGIHSHVLLPLLSSSHLRCHDFFTISVQTYRASNIDIPFGASLKPLLISLAASFALWSAVSLPMILEWPGIFTSFTSHELSTSLSHMSKTLSQISEWFLNCEWTVKTSIALWQSHKICTRSTIRSSVIS